MRFERDIEDTANDVRNAIAARGRLPADIDETGHLEGRCRRRSDHLVQLGSNTLDRIELTDYAERYLVDQLSVIDGVAGVRVAGMRPALRIWLDTDAMAARGLTVDDIESALRMQNVELPAGYVESRERDYEVRVAHAFQTPEDFPPAIRRDPLRAGRHAGRRCARGDGAQERRVLFRGDGADLVGLGIVRRIALERAGGRQCGEGGDRAYGTRAATGVSIGMASIPQSSSTGRSSASRRRSPNPRPLSCW